MKRKPPSEATRAKNRERERARRARLVNDPAWRERERLRAAENNAKRSQEQRERYRATNAARMAQRRADDPSFAEQQRQGTAAWHERRRIDRQFDAFISNLEAEPR